MQTLANTRTTDSSRAIQSAIAAWCSTVGTRLFLTAETSTAPTRRTTSAHAILVTISCRSGLALCEEQIREAWKLIRVLSDAYHVSYGPCVKSPGQLLWELTFNR